MVHLQECASQEVGCRQTCKSSISYMVCSSFASWKLLGISCCGNDSTVKPLSYGPLRYGHLPQPGSRFALFYADIAEIVGSTVGVAYYSLST